MQFPPPGSYPLENKDSYVRMLLIDFSSAFNTIIPQQLINKLNLLGLNNSLCNWILDLTGRPVSPSWPQHLEHYHTEHRCPTGLCAQPAALHAADPRLHWQVQLQPIIKFSDDTSVVGLINNNDEHTTERNWHSWLNGVVQTTCPSM